MPTFEYACEGCNTVFEELFLQKEEIKQYSAQHPCKNCGAVAKRIPSATNFTFKAPSGQTQGTGVHGQSGVHDLDYPSLDKAIGRSANHKWKEYRGRKAARDAVRRQAGTNSVTVDGEKVTPTDPSKMEVRQKAFNIMSKAKSQNPTDKPKAKTSTSR